MEVIFYQKKENYIATAAYTEETAEELFAEIGPELSEDEKLHLKSFKHPKRKKEWLALRVFLKRTTGNYPGIAYNEFGKPILPGSQQISISHSNNYVAFVLSPSGRPGIDIELMNKNIRRTAHKFTKLSQLPPIPDAKLKRHLYTLWCGKETLFKIYEKGELDFKKHLHIYGGKKSESGELTGLIKKGNAEKHCRLYYEFLIHQNKEIIITYGFEI